jgi:hypothetical protein
MKSSNGLRKILRRFSTQSLSNFEGQRYAADTRDAEKSVKYFKINGAGGGNRTIRDARTAQRCRRRESNDTRLLILRNLLQTYERKNRKTRCMPASYVQNHVQKFEGRVRSRTLNHRARPYQYWVCPHQWIPHRPYPLSSFPVRTPVRRWGAEGVRSRPCAGVPNRQRRPCSATSSSRRSARNILSKDW